MKHFREDNTEGYSAAQLAELNRRFDKAMDEAYHFADELDEKHMIDAIAERILAKFDAEFA